MEDEQSQIKWLQMWQTYFKTIPSWSDFCYLKPVRVNIFTWRQKPRRQHSALLRHFGEWWMQRRQFSNQSPSFCISIMAALCWVHPETPILCSAVNMWAVSRPEQTTAWAAQTQLSPFKVVFCIRVWAEGMSSSFKFYLVLMELGRLFHIFQKSLCS